jgi:transposase
MQLENVGQQNWSVYNEAQTTEKLIFLDLLSDLCSYIPEEDERKVGRPRAGLSNMVFACVSKVYEGLSSRRVTSDLEITRQRGYLEHTPHFNTVLKYFNDPKLTPLLTSLIQLSALPLKDLEETFAVDASGLSSAFYSRWLDYRLTGEKRYKDWIKVHLICGVKTNIVTHIVVTDGQKHDSPMFPTLLKETAKNFNIKEVCADKGYSGRNNVQTAWDMGITPYILFRNNTVQKSRGASAWRNMFILFQDKNDFFMRKYHQRSNVESTFSMLKRKFDGKLMLKKEIGKTNEALAKVLCHNICVLIHEICSSGIDLKFNELAHKFPSLHIKELSPTN